MLDIVYNMLQWSSGHDGAEVVTFEWHATSPTPTNLLAMMQPGPPPVMPLVYMMVHNSSCLSGTLKPQPQQINYKVCIIYSDAA
jgi:hypothetical protein